jgi:hypothetical protein
MLSVTDLQPFHHVLGSVQLSQAFVRVFNADETKPQKKFPPKKSQMWKSDNEKKDNPVEVVINLLSCYQVLISMRMELHYYHSPLVKEPWL